MRPQKYEAWLWKKVSSYLILRGFKPFERDNPADKQKDWEICRAQAFDFFYKKYSKPCPKCGRVTEPNPRYYYRNKARYNGLMSTCRRCS